MGDRNHNSIPCEGRDLYLHTGLSGSASLLANGFLGASSMGVERLKRDSRAEIENEWSLSLMRLRTRATLVLCVGDQIHNTQPYGPKKGRRYSSETCFFLKVKK
jgi:hypothetical protein